MVMLEKPSPPVLSTRMPGIYRKISATERGLYFSISLSLRVLVEVALSRRSRARATPVVMRLTRLSADFGAASVDVVSLLASSLAARACEGRMKAVASISNVFNFTIIIPVALNSLSGIDFIALNRLFTAIRIFTDSLTRHRLGVLMTAPVLSTPVAF